MSQAPAYSIKMSIQRLVCSSCGAEANASCNCGVAYIPKSERAAEAIKANPEKSNRAIAEEIGVSRATVNRARGSHEPTNTGPTWGDFVTGKDGKKYPAKAKPKSKSKQRLPKGLTFSAKAVPEAIAEGLYEQLGPQIAVQVCAALLDIIKAKQQAAK